MPAEAARAEAAAGERLKAARESRGLAVEQVADALHLDETVIIALEESRFDGLGAPVFVRGHLRAYARLLELPEEPLLSAVAPEPAPVPPAAAKRSRAGEAMNFNPLFWVLGLCGLLLAAGLAWYVLSDRDDRAARGGLAPTPSPSPAPGLAPSPAVAARPVTAGDRPAVPGVAPAEAAARPPEQASAPAVVPVPAAATGGAVAGGSELTLELEFHDESWTEIADRNRRLLFGLQRAGTRRRLRGEPPFSLLLGNAPAVEIRVDGEPWPLPARRGNGRVARFIIDPAETGE